MPFPALRGPRALTGVKRARFGFRMWLALALRAGTVHAISGELRAWLLVRQGAAPLAGSGCPGRPACRVPCLRAAGEASTRRMFCTWWNSSPISGRCVEFFLSTPALLVTCRMVRDSTSASECDRQRLRLRTAAPSRKHSSWCPMCQAYWRARRQLSWPQVWRCYEFTTAGPE